MSILTIGTVAFDAIETPFDKVDRILGGSATYASLAARYFTSHRAGTDELSVPIRAHSIVGCEDSGTILVISADQTEMLRVDLDTGEREVVFPRP